MPEIINQFIIVKHPQIFLLNVISRRPSNRYFAMEDRIRDLTRFRAENVRSAAEELTGIATAIA